MKSTQQGAETVIYLASSPEVKGITGKYFKNNKAVKSSKDSYNAHLARKLWQFSEEQTGLLKEV